MKYIGVLARTLGKAESDTKAYEQIVYLVMELEGAGVRNNGSEKGRKEQ